MTYTTQELITILDQELQANWKGERIVFSSETRIDNPVISKAINMDKVSKVFAYRDFRKEIHGYQLENQVSGIIWREATFRGQKISFPQIHNQLIPIPGDKQILVDYKKEIISFWYGIIEELNIWLMEKNPQQITLETVKKLAKQAEWAEIEAAQTELYLGLCWGNPSEYQYKWAYPNSGCDRLVASVHPPGLIKF
jgi:hypothetical protein